MGGEIGKQPKLGARQAHRPGAGRPGGRREAVAKLSRVLDERAQVGAELEHILGLSENRAGGGRLAEREMDARELEPDSDGYPGNAVVEHGPQAVGTRQGRAGILRPRLVERDTCRRDVHDRARGVVAEARLLDERLLPPVRVAQPRPRLLPWPRGARAAPAPRRPLRRCRWPAPLDGCKKLHHCTIGRAEQGVRNSSAEECGRDPKTVSAEADPAPASASASACSTPLRHHVRPQRGDPGLDRGAAVRERDLRGRPVGEGEPALSILGSPRQRPPPGSVDGERGVLHKLVVAEPPEPLLQGLHAAVVVERRTKGVDQAGDGVRLARRVTVADRLLGQIVGDDTRPSHDR